MTEPLTRMLHAEADILDVPPPDARAVLHAGRRQRRRRQALAGGVTAAATVLAIGGGALVVNGLDDDSQVQPAAPADLGAVFAIDSTVYLDGGKVQATIDDKAVKSLYYTSAGVLVRHGNNANSDGGGPQRFSLVRPDGSVDPIDVATEGTVHATDPGQPYLAYAEMAGDHAEVVVHDVRNDTEAARVALPGNPRSNWPAPPVALSGDTVLAETSAALYAVDWRAGEVTEAEDVSSEILPVVEGGRTTDERDGEVAVLDASTGETLLSVPTPPQDEGYAYLDLAPDGRHATVSTESFGGDELTSTFEVYDVATGRHVALPSGSYGWTTGGDLFTVTKDEVRTCEPATGECTSALHGIEMPATTPERQECYDTREGKVCDLLGGETWENRLRLGGRMYES